jgi:RNA polymerase sigma-70 factor (ECF subfamily)
VSLAIAPDDIDRLVELYGPAVWRTICRLLGGAREAADCFQETFLEFIHAHRRRKIDRPQALLQTIATRRAIDSIRRQSTQRRQLTPLSDRHASSILDPPSLAVGRELADWLLEALKEIDPVQAAVFCMTQLDQMDHQEVAAAMGVTPNHVGVLLHRARSKLQKKLAENTAISRGEP